MERVKVTDEWLYKYMPVVDAAIIQELENQVDTRYEFSRKFERKMKRLIKREAHPWIGVMKSITKRVAAIFIGVIGITLIVTMSVEAYRVKFFETIKTFFEDSVLFSYFVSQETEMFQNNEPTYVPEGYSEVNRIENEIDLIIIYENKIGEQIVWEQKLVSHSSSILFDTECDSQETRNIKGAEAIVYSYLDGYSMAYYEYEQYAYIITADNIMIEELFKIIDSMK